MTDERDTRTVAFRLGAALGDQDTIDVRANCLRSSPSKNQGAVFLDPNLMPFRRAEGKHKFYCSSE